MNQINIMGRLVRDPERKQDGPTRFTVAVDRRFKDKDGNKQTDFFACMAWGKVAELIARDFTKGRPIMVSGQMQSRHYEKDGVSRTMWEVNVADYWYVDSRDIQEPRPAPPQAQPEPRPAVQEELPFDL